MSFESLIQIVSLAAIPVLFAITLHEVAHGLVAKRLGDLTAHAAGRLSLNPIHHIDPVGTVILPILMLWASSGSFLFGWAKPVPVNFGHLRRPKQDMFWVSLAGPAANLLMAIAWAAVGKLALGMDDGNQFATPLMGMAQIGITINAVLCVLNLLPLPPLDGGRIAVSLLPHRQAYQLAKLEPYGMFILLFLALTPLLGWILLPPVRGLIGFIGTLFGL